jgi:hypothetical protein
MAVGLGLEPGRGAALLKLGVERGQLSGEWVGESVDTAGVRTEWVDTTFTFTFHPARAESPGGGNESSFSLVEPPSSGGAGGGSGGGAAGELRFAGGGVSLWRGRRVHFDASGVIDLASGRAVVAKQHTGAFTNKVEYRGHLLAVPASDSRDYDARWAAATQAPPWSLHGGGRTSGAPPGSASLEALRRERAGALLSDHSQALRAALYGKDDGAATLRAADAEGDVALVAHEVTIVGVYPQGRLRLRRRLAPWSRCSPHGARFYRNSGSGSFDVAEGPLPAPLREKGDEEEEARTKVHTTRVNRWRTFLFGGVVCMWVCSQLAEAWPLSTSSRCTPT